MATDNQDLNEIAEAFDRQTDPLQEYERKFSQIDVDPFKSFVERVLEPTDPSQSTLKNYRHSFEHWEEFMSREGRHPACPNEAHIKRFAEYLAVEQDNADSTIRRKIDNLGRAYAWWQDHYAFPHPTDYDPFSIAKREMDLSTDGEQDKYPRLTNQQISGVIQSCTNVRERLNS